jgi:hypothetical protein
MQISMITQTLIFRTSVSRDIVLAVIAKIIGVSPA